MGVLPPPVQKLARWTLACFVPTFLLSRVFVLLIMTGRMPDLFLFVGQTHVHHLNYGIFLLVTVGGWAVFARPNGFRTLRWLAALYGVGLALTFDEFGLWLHLGGGYWQRDSYDAVVVIAALLGLLTVAPSLRHWRRRQWLLLAAIVVVCAAGLKLMGDQLNAWTPILQRIEQLGPHV